MKIVKLTAENFKRLVAVEITPDGNVVKITGRNGAGKSSVLDSIVAALGGGKEAPAMPIRAGQDKSVVVVETDEYTITRTFTEKGSYLKIANKEGFEARSPQALLNKIVGAIAFDPLAFIREKDTRVQRELLLNLVGLDLSAIDAEITQAKTEASLVRRQLNAAKVSLEQLPDPGDAGNEEATIDVSVLIEELTAAREKNIAIKKYIDAEAALIIKAQRLRDQIKDLQAQLEATEDAIEANHEAATKLGDAQDIEPIQRRIEEAKTHNVEVEAHNQRVRNAAVARERRAATEAAAAKVKEQLDALVEKAANLERQKVEALAKTTFPVPGLSVDESGITFEGIPLAQVNHAKQLEIGMAISMRLNPTLRVMLVDGNGLDSVTLATIKKAAKDSDYQVWMEQMDESGSVGIVIEDGHIKPKEGVRHDSEDQEVVREQGDDVGGSPDRQEVEVANPDGA